jgi:hypothetical protein
MDQFVCSGLRRASALLAAVAPLVVAGCGTPAWRPPSPDLAFSKPPSGTCVGQRPPAAAFGVAPGPARAGDAGASLPGVTDGGCSGPGCPSVSAPRFALTDFQSASCGFGATYGLDQFQGQVVLAGLWAGW